MFTYWEKMKHDNNLKDSQSVTLTKIEFMKTQVNEMVAKKRKQ